MDSRLKQIQLRIANAINKSHKKRDVSLVAVSKLQPIEAIVSLYKCGQRLFGENYIQELLTKASDKTIQENCPQIEWRFIGNLQTNKVNQLLRVDRLSAVQSVDSLKIARTLNRKELDIWIQVNTSGELNKKGISPKELIVLVKDIQQNCEKLRIQGLMTIGRQDNDVIPNPDFQTLLDCALIMQNETNIKPKLSFGMSDDFEHAIEMGSDEVRVGTALFGQRNQ